MIDSIRGLGSNNYGSYNTAALGQGQPVSSAGSGGSGEGECCCCNHGQDSVSFSPEALQMMMAGQ